MNQLSKSFGISKGCCLNLFRENTESREPLVTSRISETSELIRTYILLLPALGNWELSFRYVHVLAINHYSSSYYQN